MSAVAGKPRDAAVNFDTQCLGISDNFASGLELEVGKVKYLYAPSLGSPLPRPFLSLSLSSHSSFAL